MILAADAPPLIDAATATIVCALITVVFGGLFSLHVKRSRSPADKLAERIAADEAAARRIRAEQERDAAKEQGFREAAEFVKKSAESAIAIYSDQTVELRETIAVLTSSLETHQRIKEAERELSAFERQVNEETITRLKARIAALEEQVTNLLNLTHAQQLKIDVLEGRAPVELSDDIESTIPRSEFEHLKSAMNMPLEETA